VIKTLKEFWREHKILLLTWLCGLILLLQVMNLHSYVVMTTDHQSIVQSNDDDAGYNVGKAIKTRWWKDNGWVLYGPFYFRINHTIHYFWGRTADPAYKLDQEVWERTAHHSILTVSLLSVVAWSLIIASFLLVPWWQRFLCAFGLTAAFTSIPAYAEFILRAHPDMLFTLFCVGGLALTIKMFQKPAEKLWFWLSATIWGFSVSVKMTVGLCAPGFLFLFVPAFNKANLRRGLKYLGIMLVAYFLIGFPQTIVLDRPFRAIAKLSSISAPVTLASIQTWLSLFFHHLWPPLAVIGLAAIDFERRKWTLPKGAQWRIWLFVLLPFALMLGKNMMVPFNHYTVAFVAMLVLVVATLLPLPQLIKRDEYPVLRGALFFTMILVIFGSTPQAMQTALTKRLECRDQARDVYLRIQEFYNQGLNIWLDPYVPFLTYAPKDRLEVSWEKTWSGYERGNWQVMVFNENQIGNYTAPGGPSAYTRADIPGWEKVREFYLAFRPHDEAKTPQGHMFKKVFKNSCGHEIWLRQQP